MQISRCQFPTQNPIILPSMVLLRENSWKSTEHTLRSRTWSVPSTSHTHLLLVFPLNSTSATLASSLLFFILIFEKTLRFTVILGRTSSFPSTSCLPTGRLSTISHYQHPSPEWYLRYNWWLYIDTSLSVTLVYIRAHTLGVVHS